VRVDSIKLFTVSSFAAELWKSRSRIPLLPLPFVEVPYIGSVAGIPLPAAKKYHTSTAVLSAIVVPTAADLAYGLAFVNDRFLAPQINASSSTLTCSPKDGTEPACQTRRAVSLRDFRSQPIADFHRETIRCLATGKACGDITFEKFSSSDADERQ
jgi:hypothetical protein